MIIKSQLCFQTIITSMNIILQIISVCHTMVCEKCEKKGKLGKVITPDPWKAGASNTTRPGGRKVGENKLLSASKNRFNPLTSEFKKCRICKVRCQLHPPHTRMTDDLFAAKGSPGGFPLLPAVRLQERYLCHVWGQDTEDSGISSVGGLVN